MMRSLDRVDLASFPEADFWSRSHPVSETGCWLWMGAVTGSNVGGYGALKFQQVVLFAHQVAYRLAHGELPAGTEVSHRCHVRSCINPGHLIAETHAENCARRPRTYRKPAVCSTSLASAPNLGTGTTGGNVGAGPASGNDARVGGGR